MLFAETGCGTCAAAAAGGVAHGCHAQLVFAVSAPARPGAATRSFFLALRVSECRAIVADAQTAAQMDQAKNARALKRITKELELLQGAQALPFAKVELKEKTELLIWKVTLQGPAASPYEKGAFVTEIDLRGGYPFKHPSVVFSTKVSYGAPRKRARSSGTQLWCARFSTPM